MIRALLAAAVLLGAVAAPAEARLGESFLRFKNSKMLDGDRLFRFEGRTGSRFRFGPASRSVIGGTGMLLLDTIDGMIVQETIILPLPHNTRQMKRMDDIAKLFLEDCGLGKPEVEGALACFRETYTTAKPVEKQLGEAKKLNVNTFASPQLAHVMLAVGIRPDGEATPKPADD